MFTHLHTHSNFSFMNGITSPQELVREALCNGMTSLALTDFQNLTGAIEFYETCQENGIKPILGLEFTLKHPLGSGNMVVLGINQAGWSNLCKLSSIANNSSNPETGGKISTTILERYSDGLICLSGGKLGLAYRLNKPERDSYLGLIADIFKDRFYIELQEQEKGDAESIRKLVSTANQMGVPIVATNNIHYIKQEQHQLQMTLSAIRQNTTLDLISDKQHAPADSYFKSSHRMINHFLEIPEAINNTQEIANRCNLDLPLGVPHYPEIPLQPGETAIGRLRNLAEIGAIQKYGKITTRIQERLNHELDAIQGRGYAPLYLIVHEILEYARTSDIPTSSRGSAASSLVAYCLGITTPDPLKLNLYFERFLNPARSSPPDIDTDLCSIHRKKVIEHVFQHYGKNRVAMVATINHFQRRSALREVAKVYGLSRPEINEITSLLPSRGWNPTDRHINPLSDDPYVEIRHQCQDERLQAVVRDAIEIIGLPRHLSVHPGGIVISPGLMTNLVPTHLANKGILITQFDLKSIERLGLVKIDLLGTRGLTVIGDVAEKIHQWRNSEFPNRLSVLDSIPEDDPETSSLLSSTQTVGCFAIESPGMRATLREIDASTPEDIMIALALYRPGPMTGGLKDSFVRRHLGKEIVQHIHPALEGLLKNTFGVILYQEQVLRISSELAGLSLSDSDLLRRAMSHFDPGDQMKTLKTRFVNGALEKSGVPESASEQIWELMAAFAGYGFPKAHAASYAQVAWRSAWCKAHHPVEFMAAVLAGWGGYYRQHVYLNEARHLNLSIHPPHINHSLEQFTSAYPKGLPTLYMGLDQIKGLTRTTKKRTIARRPFTSIDDFLTHVDPRPKEVENLIMVGAFNGLGKIPELLLRVKARDWRLNQPRLFEMALSNHIDDDWDLGHRLVAQREILGVEIEAHPVELLKDFVTEIGAVTTLQALEMSGSEVKVIGVRRTHQRFHSPSSETYHLLELDDSVGVLPVRLTEDIFQKNRGAILSHNPIYLAGNMVADLDSKLVYLDARIVKGINQTFVN